MRLRCLIIEDEPLAVERLVSFARQLSTLEVVATFSSGPEALDYLAGHPVEVIFLDVGLQGPLSGLELLETTRLQAQIILTTAHRDHALRAFDLRVTDYLLKPFSFPRFVQAVERVSSRRPLAAEQPFFFVKSALRLERIAFAEVLYIEGRGDYRAILLPAREVLTLETFTELEQRLPPARLCRVHKSYMVALDKIDSVERDRITIGAKRVPISDGYRAAFYARIGQGSPGKG
jgi:DNA-binding LytR/AlgR family response regulator